MQRGQLRLHRAARRRGRLRRPRRTGSACRSSRSRTACPTPPRAARRTRGTGQPAGAVARALAPGDDRPQQGREEHPPPPQPGHGVVGRRGDARSRAAAPTCAGSGPRRASGSSTRRPRPGNPIDNATLPALAAMGGRLDPTLAYKLVNAADGRVLASRAESRRRSTPAPDTGHHGPAAAVAAPRPGRRPRAERDDLPDADGPSRRRLLPDRQLDRANGFNVLDGDATPRSSQSPQTADVFAIAGTDRQPGVGRRARRATAATFRANCTGAAAVSDGDGNYYMIVNKATGRCCRDPARASMQQAPAAPSNGDWIEPANKGQLWRIVAGAHHARLARGRVRQGDGRGLMSAVTACERD